MTSYAQTLQLADTLGSKLIGFDNTNVYDKLKGAPVSLAEFTGSTVTALNAAMFKFSISGGGFLFIPSGVYSLASAELSTPILIPSNVTLECSGAQFTITGSGFIGSVFRSVNASNIIIRNLQVFGNSMAVADGTSGAFYNFVQDTSGTGCENILVDNVRLQNFAAERWVSILNQNATFPITCVRIRNLRGYSLSGNSIGPASIGTGSNLITVYGVTAPINNVRIENLWCDATYIKRGIDIFHMVTDVVIENPTILNAGQGGASNDCGAYAINCYGNVGEMSRVTIRNPNITAPRSIGIYLRGLDTVTVINPMINGQLDTTITTLPKGAIAGDGATNVDIIGGQLSGNAYDIMIAGSGNSTLDWRISAGLVARGCTAGSLLINPGAGAGYCANVSVDATCEFTAGGNGTTQLPKAVIVRNNIGGTGKSLSGFTFLGKCAAPYNIAMDLNAESQTSVPVLNYTLGGSYGAGAAAFGINAGDCAGDITIRDGTEIYDASASLSNAGLFANSRTTKLNILGLLLRDMASGYGLNTVAAQGTQDKIRFRNMVNPFAANSMGSVVPTVAGTLGDYVQNISPVEAGAAASKYVNTGWRYTTSWLQQRTLTGN